METVRRILPRSCAPFHREQLAELRHDGFDMPDVALSLTYPNLTQSPDTPSDCDFDICAALNQENTGVRN
jgi:hypothetical protein